MAFYYSNKMHAKYIFFKVKRIFECTLDSKLWPNETDQVIAERRDGIGMVLYPSVISFSKYMNENLYLLNALKVGFL